MTDRPYTRSRATGDFSTDQPNMEVSELRELDQDSASSTPRSKQGEDSYTCTPCCENVTTKIDSMTEVMNQSYGSLSTEIGDIRDGQSKLTESLYCLREETHCLREETVNKISEIDGKIEQQHVEVKGSLKAMIEQADKNRIAADAKFDSMLGRMTERDVKSDAKLDSFMKRLAERDEKSDAKFDSLLKETKASNESFNAKFDSLLKETKASIRIVLC